MILVLIFSVWWSDTRHRFLTMTSKSWGDSDNMPTDCLRPDFFSTYVIEKRHPKSLWWTRRLDKVTVFVTVLRVYTMKRLLRFEVLFVKTFGRRVVNRKVVLKGLRGFGLDKKIRWYLTEQIERVLFYIFFFWWMS